jgi:hypothetical protein
MSSTRNRQIILVGVTALVTFLVSAIIFSMTDVNLFGAAGDATTTGTVLDVEGNPAKRTLVQTYAADGSVFLDVTDRNGIFELDKLANGTYIFSASSVDHQYAYIGEWVIDDNSGEAQFEVALTGSLVGTVPGCDATCTVTLTYQDIAIVVQTTQADGSFVISGLAPATYTLTAYRGQAVSDPVTVEILSAEQGNTTVAF